MNLDVTQQGSIAVACVSGEIDMSNGLQFSDEVLGRMGDSATGLVIDATELQFIDSAGVRSLFDIAATLKMRDQFFGIAVLPSSPLRSVLKLTQVDDVASICGTVEECIDLASAPHA